jgi:V/A-type H+-transporting ATPase subunit I
VEVEEADGDDVPVLLQNNAFSSPAEGVLESYSLPGKGEIDPTSIMSVFYYVFFGLMLADAFYGAIMFFVCFILTKKYKNMSPGLYKNLKLFMFCGISTCFWGIMFGGYFGDVVTVIAKVFFNTDFTIPAVWFVPLNDPMRMLMFSFVLGLIHLFIGLGIKGYQLIKNSGIKDFIYDVIFWFALLIGLIIMLLPSEIFASIAGSPINIPAVIVKIGQGLAIIGALGIIITNGRSSRNWGKRLMKGAYELYGISGWLSDVLSYSRLMALGLASGVIASVFNQMGSMGGSSIFGAIVFVIVFLVGHALNLGINLLGSYVHTNRLQFVEFFGKFYEGGGEAFKPFASNTKYIQVKEETK